jgi:hypothetical protein
MTDREENRVPRETARAFTKRLKPKDEQLEITRKENQRIREKMKNIRKEND